MRKQKKKIEENNIFFLSLKDPLLKCKMLFVITNFRSNQVLPNILKNLLFVKLGYFRWKEVIVKQGRFKIK